MRPLLGLAVAAALLVSGCLDDSPPVTARGIDEAPVDAGEGPFTLRILVTHGPGGEPVPGAGVVVYWPEIEMPEIDVNSGPDGGGVSISFDTPTIEGVLRLSTGPDGIAVARLEAGRSVGIVVAADGYTEEWLPGVPTGQEGEQAQIAVPIFLSQINLGLNQTWAGPGHLGLMGTAWDPQPIVFHEDPAIDQGYRDRLVGLQVQVAWTNDLSGLGDLAAAAGPSPDTIAEIEDSDSNASPGDQSETLIVEAGQLAEDGLRGAGALFAGPATQTGALAPGGLPYEISVTADFSGAGLAFATSFA